jgi:hypothetical protein
MTGDDRKMASLGPATVAVHDDGHMKGLLTGVDRSTADIFPPPAVTYEKTM